VSSRIDHRTGVVTVTAPTTWADVGHRLYTSWARASVELAEFAIAAAGAKERQVGRLVVGEVGAPAVGVGGEPGPSALDALRDQGDAVDSHAVEDRARQQPSKVL
jgi:hypothetical protein